MIKRKYITDSQIDVCMERLDDNKLQLAQDIIERFEVENEADPTLCGNVRVTYLESEAVLTDFLCEEKEGQTTSYEQISSALALYRTISLFQCGLSAGRADFYKLNWMVVLKHKETGKYLGLGEWKGGFQIFTEGQNLSKLSKTFIHDAEELLTLLASPDCPIGYDGVVAGSVA